MTSAGDTDRLNRRADYHMVLTTYFDDDELNTLCFEIGVDYDALPATGQYGKARELIEYMERRGKIDRLRQKILNKRPFLDLD